MIHPVHSRSITLRTLPRNRGGQRDAAVLPAADHQSLKEHLEHCMQFPGAQSTLLAHLLSHKIRQSRPVLHAHCSDMATGGCRVTYAVDGGVARTGRLVHRVGGDDGEGVIPVASLLGATLIGMRVGQRAPLLRQDGTIGRLLVIDVAHLPPTDARP